LDPADDGHGRRPSEQFRFEQRVDQINEQSRGHERSERIVKDHDPISSELFAGVNIGDRQREEADRERHHHDVHHENAPDEIFKIQAETRRREMTLISIKTVREIPGRLGATSALERIGIRVGLDGNRIGIP
jgi:hypothetical protein